MTMNVYNTLTRQKEPFQTLEPGIVRMYVCGPTVYDEAHIGHGMSAIVFDTIRRYLEYKGYQVRHVMNFTDVDDKIIVRARELGRDALELAQVYVDKFQQHLEDLNVLPPTVTPRVSSTIDEIIAMVESLIEQGYAYESERDVYFRVRQDEDYGKLSRRTIEQAVSSSRIRFGDDLKEDAADFALWKGQKEPDEPVWPSPWGLGRPGWHIECSAMARRHLGITIDIHGGGNDLIFPHHENEIAQSESCHGAPFATYWMHNGMLQLKGEKMSKSLGNIVSIDAFLAEHDADTFRLLVLGSHYRKPLAFDEDVVEQARRGLERLRSALRAGRGDAATGPEAVNGTLMTLMQLIKTDPEASVKLQKATEEARARFEMAMDDDFNTAGALSHLYDLVKAINTARDAGVGGAPFTTAQATLIELSAVLGLRLAQEDARAGGEAAPFIDLLLEVRSRLREQKLWAMSDLIRDRLAGLGVLVEDGREGTTWRWER